MGIFKDVEGHIQPNVLMVMQGSVQLAELEPKRFIGNGRWIIWFPAGARGP